MSDISNLRDTIIAKSDQLNADDIVGGTITVTVTAVKRGDSNEQPVVIHYQGDNGRPYKPCKTMRRVLIAGWGENGAAWIGRSMTLFNEPSVKFGGVAVGGIRISHMTDIGNGLLLTPNASKGKKQSISIKPLVMQAAKQSAPEPQQDTKPELTADKWPAVIAAIESGKCTAEYIRGKYALTDEQDNELHALGAG
jgi:hypothetical protein